MSNGWLKCGIFKGMFSDEVAVKVSSAQGDDTSFFVSREKVVGAVNGEGKVRVRIFREGDIAWAILPTENAVTIAVRESDLVPA